VQTPVATSSTQKPPSILKSLALAVGTLTLSTWALGTLWMHAESDERAQVNPDVVATNAP
jgi:hypothetical protein